MKERLRFLLNQLHLEIEKDCLVDELNKKCNYSIPIMSGALSLCFPLTIFFLALSFPYAPGFCFVLLLLLISREPHQFSRFIVAVLFSKAHYPLQLVEAGKWEKKGSRICPFEDHYNACFFFLIFTVINEFTIGTTNLPYRVSNFCINLPPSLGWLAGALITM